MSEFEFENFEVIEDDDKDEFESEFEDEFEDELEKAETEKEAEQSEQMAGSQEAPGAEIEEEPELTLREKLEIVFYKIKEIYSIALFRIKAIEIHLPYFKKKLSIFQLLQYIVYVGVCFIFLNYGYTYYKYLKIVFDDSFLENYQVNNMGSAGYDDVLSEDDEAIMEDFGSVFELKNILLNVKRNKTKYSLLKLSIGMEVGNEELLDELQQRQKQLKHLIILHLSNRTFDDLRNKKKRIELKKFIRSQINGVLKAGSIRKIFFTEYIVN